MMIIAEVLASLIFLRKAEMRRETTTAKESIKRGFIRAVSWTSPINGIL